MIEVSASLQGRTVFIAGETIECHIKFTNITKDSPSTKQSVSLAWASAQIHCQCCVTDGRVLLPNSSLGKAASSSSNQTLAGNDTSFVPFKGERGFSAKATRPTILFCDLNLKAGESYHCIYSETLPLDGPASFKGSAAKYSYKITIGAQRFNSFTHLLKVPIRVLVVPGLKDLNSYIDNNSDDAKKPSNPFKLRPTHGQDSLLDIALDILQTLACRKGPSFYNITNQHGNVARFSLFRQAYRIGDDIIATLDFGEASIPCIQYSVTLQTEECVNPEYRAGNIANMVVSYCKTEQLCVNICKTHVKLTIPLNATPNLTTDIVTLTWRLHLEFVTSKQPLPQIAIADQPTKPTTLKGPAEVTVETMTWDLPIKVYATNPTHVSSVSLLPIAHTITV